MLQNQQCNGADSGQNRDDNGTNTAAPSPSPSKSPSKSKNSVLRTDEPAEAGIVAAGQLDARMIVWNDGLAALVRLIGKPPAATRTFLGKCLKTLKDDCAVMQQIIREAEETRPIDPAGWISAAVKSRATGPAGSAFDALMNSLPPRVDRELKTEHHPTISGEAVEIENA